MKELIIKGLQEVLGKEIPVLEGGFREGKRCITDKNIAEIHNMKVIHVREAVNKNIKRFKENIDFIQQNTAQIVNSKLVNGLNLVVESNRKLASNISMQNMLETLTLNLFDCYFK